MTETGPESTASGDGRSLRNYLNCGAETYNAVLSAGPRLGWTSMLIFGVLLYSEDMLYHMTSFLDIRANQEGLTG
jgi:hypothetical protein